MQEVTMIKTQNTIALTDNVAIPLVGFGTYQIAPDDASSTVEAAIVAGYRHIDTAEAYQNEAGVGQGIKAGMAATAARRQDLFVTTKVWPGNAAWGDPPKTYEGTVTAFETSLAALGLEYIDLYL